MLAFLFLSLLAVSWVAKGFSVEKRGGVARYHQQIQSRRSCTYRRLQSTSVSDEHTTAASPQLGAWVPVGSTAALQGLGPMAIEMFHRQFVVWQPDATRAAGSRSNWSVQLDECPHRLAPLSQGRVDPVDGCIECPYHGWKFDTEGTLTRIPQLEEGRTIPPKSDVTSFPVHLTGDILWAFLPTSMHGESFPITLLPEDYYEGLSSFNKKIFITRDLPYSYDFLMENLCDGPGHAPFAHHSIGFDRSDAVPVPIEIITSNFTRYEYETGYDRHGVTRKRRLGIQRPFSFFQREPIVGPSNNNNDGWKIGILFFAVPIREGHSRVITSLDKLSKGKGATVPMWKTHHMIQRFFETDLWVHDAEIAARRRRGGENQDQSRLLYRFRTTSDIAVSAYRDWWKKVARLAMAPPHAFGAASEENLVRLSRQEMIDPWKSHTKHCSICRHALKRAQRVLRLSLGLAAAGALMVLLKQQHHQKRRIVGGLVCLLVSWFLRVRSELRIVALEGEPSPSRISDRSFAVSD